MKYFKTVLTLVIFFAINISGQHIESMLSKTLEKLNALSCIAYTSINRTSAPYDSVLVNQYTDYYKVLFEPSDTLMGSRFLLFEDTAKIYISYNKDIAAFYNWENKTINIDTLDKKRPSVMAPFYIEVKELLKYVIANKDSILFMINDYKDSLKITFTIKNKLAYFSSMVRSIYVKPNSDSKYILWINKELMPYRLKTIMPHQTACVDIVSLSNCNASEITEKQIGIYIQEGFTIKNKRGVEITTTILENKEAPNWSLKNLEGKNISLSDYKGKNLLIEFTGLGCGYCHIAIPFINSFTKQYKEKGFEVVSIETYSDNIEGLKRYKNQNQMIYEFLIADKETKVAYKILGLPVFILVNKKGIIEKAFIGYGKGETDKLIKSVADKM